MQTITGAVAGEGTRPAQTIRGRLKIFLGAAPGAGKTYAMLAEANAIKSAGGDVVIGIFARQQRSENDMLARGFETLPRSVVIHRRRSHRAFDLAAALARRPGLILVDELAHANAPASRNAKRWQDIVDLLDAGIDVWTTVNIQHLESLRNLVLEIGRMEALEAIPDSFFRAADEIVFINCPRETLLERSAQGKSHIRGIPPRNMDRFLDTLALAQFGELAARYATEYAS
jgi:two-component system sensor histidine kinase KdpD